MPLLMLAAFSCSCKITYTKQTTTPPASLARPVVYHSQQAEDNNKRPDLDSDRKTSVLTLWFAKETIIPYCGIQGHSLSDEKDTVNIHLYGKETITKSSITAKQNIPENMENETHLPHFQPADLAPVVFRLDSTSALILFSHVCAV